VSSPNRCPICRVSISQGHLMCGKHWGLVPLALRSRILGLFRNAPGSEAHRSACFEAVRQVVTLLRPRPPEPPRAA
jgi:hypothetical protein